MKNFILICLAVIIVSVVGTKLCADSRPSGNTSGTIQGSQIYGTITAQLSLTSANSAYWLAHTPGVGVMVYDSTLGCPRVGNGVTTGGIPILSTNTIGASQTNAMFFVSTNNIMSVTNANGGNQLLMLDQFGDLFVNTTNMQTTIGNVSGLLCSGYVVGTGFQTLGMGINASSTATIDYSQASLFNILGNINFTVSSVNVPTSVSQLNTLTVCNYGASPITISFASNFLLATNCSLTVGSGKCRIFEIYEGYVGSSISQTELVSQKFAN
jgi:hypothetical protein